MSLDAAKKLEEAAWIDRASAGDKDAFRLLVERYQGRAMALAYEILKSRSDAEDVVQESFVKAFFALKDFERNSSFYTWLYRIVHNMAIDYRRKINRRTRNEISANQPVNEESSAPQIQIPAPGQEMPDRQVAAREELLIMNQAFQELPNDHREILRLRELEGFSYQQISRILKITPGTVMSRLFYARKKLQDLMRIRTEETGDSKGNAPNEKLGFSSSAVR